ncbi:hypothetical protein [Streptomyces sp. NPDC058280]|uniref:hypothetical protein n=1 Tax=Streptomyces sp. NPDC058280 TaxID=3346419 RepID=UPI0036E35FD1
MTERTREERAELHGQSSKWDLVEELLNTEDGIDRYRAAWESARRRAKWARRSMDSDLRFTRNMWGDALRDLYRYRLAWLSARRRAADEANFGLEALELKNAELAQQEARHKSYTAELQPLIHKRMDELRRARHFVAEVSQVRNWAMDAATASDLMESHLRPVYEALHELEEAQREGRPYRDRWTRVGPERMADQCPSHDTIEAAVPQPAPCTCGSRNDTVAYWRAELERVHQEGLRKSTSGAQNVASH